MLCDKIFYVYGLGVSGKAVCAKLDELLIKYHAWDDNADSFGKSLPISIQKNLVRLEQYDWSQTEAVILSAGIVLYTEKMHDVVQIAHSHDVSLICDVEMLYLLEKNRGLNNRFIAISGTNGKTTVTTIVDNILSLNQSLSYKVGGNIGYGALSLFDQNSRENENYILELSSYQLDLLHETEFDIACLLNITPDHLDRYHSFEHYKESKYKIFSNINPGKNQIFILNYDDPLCRELYFDLQSRNVSDALKIIAISTKYDLSMLKNSCYFNSNEVVLNYDQEEFRLPAFKPILGMRGQNSLNNFLCATAIAKGLEVDDEHILAACNNFKGVEHRLQYIGSSGRVSFFNDSKATNSASTYNALEGMNNIFLILGGSNKTDSIKDLQQFFLREGKILRVFLIGESLELFQKSLDEIGYTNYECLGDLSSAFESATCCSESDFTSLSEINILLSPACASFDQWSNFIARGNSFVALAQNYINDGDEKLG